MGIELPTIEAIKRFVAMGNGVALVPHLTVARELETGDLVRVPVDELEVKRVLRLVHRRQATLSYAARAFLRTRQDAGQGAGTAVLLPCGAGRLRECSHVNLRHSSSECCVTALLRCARAPVCLHCV